MYNMKLHFENLSFGFILFYAFVAGTFAGTWLIILKNILKYIFKREFKIKPVFIWLTIILFVVFLIIALLEPSGGFRR
jgi:riboflavin transporter FmnP